MKHKKYSSKLMPGFIMIMFIFSGMICMQIAQAGTVKQDGCYRTALIKNYSKKELSYMGNSPVLKKYNLQNGKLITYGSYYYVKKIGLAEKIIKKEKRIFPISKKCTYWDDAFSPSGSGHKISKTEFFAHVKSSLKRNLPAEDIQFTVKKGKIVKMEIGQG